MLSFQFFILYLTMICSVISPAEPSDTDLLTKLESLNLEKGTGAAKVMTPVKPSIANEYENAQALIKLGMGNTYFIWLPEDCQNRIAQFIAWETDKECYERLLEFHKEKYKAVMVGQLPHGQTKSKTLLKAFDTENFQSKDLTASFGESLNDAAKALCFAVSPSEKQFAQLVEHRDQYGDKEYKIECRYRNTAKPHQIFDVPTEHQFYISIGYNNQETALILLSNRNMHIKSRHNHSRWNGEYIGMSFTLISEKQSGEKIAKSDGTLVGYFAWLIGKYENQ